MLKQFIKHEFKETARLLIPLNLILIALALFGAVLFRIDLFSKYNLEIIATSALILYILGIFVLFILTAVYLAMRFYKTMYSGQGYLTHTLPVSTTAILNTKIFVSVFWLCIAFLVTAGSALLLIMSASGESWDLSALSYIQEEFSRSMGFGFYEFLGIMAGLIVVFFFSSVLMVCASFSVGQLFRQNRLAASIAAYIVFYIAQQIISMILLVILSIGNSDMILQMQSNAASADVANFYQWLFAIVLLQSVAFSVIYYIISFYISNHKLNLE